MCASTLKRPESSIIVVTAALDPGADLQAGEVPPALPYAVQVAGNIQRRWLVDPVSYLAADCANVGGGILGHCQGGEVGVIGEGNSGHAELDGPRARLTH